jgi:hypothetical protein
MGMTTFAVAALAAGLGAFTVATIKQRRTGSPGEGARTIALPLAPPVGSSEPSRSSPATGIPFTTSAAATWPDIVRLAAWSAGRFIPLAVSRSLRLRRNRLDRAYHIDQGGTYAVFRETVSDVYPPSRPVVLVVGFRLRLIRDWALPHWLFQRACILTTPFWSGFRGFRIKLWMVDPITKNYLGIYDWEKMDQARTYLAALTRVLRPLSTPWSVFATVYPDQSLEPFLQARAVASAQPVPVAPHAGLGVPARTA